MLNGIFAAAITVAIWGLTFVFTKSLLDIFTPVEILFIRFLIGAAVLFLLSPHVLKTKGWREEKYFIAAGASGIFLYYFLENASLIWTSASNTGVIVSTAPFFTALFSKERMSAFSPLRELLFRTLPFSLNRCIQLLAWFWSKRALFTTG